jgi:hypothetical protein
VVEDAVQYIISKKAIAPTVREKNRCLDSARGGSRSLCCELTRRCREGPETKLLWTNRLTKPSIPRRISRMQLCLSVDHRPPIFNRTPVYSLPPPPCHHDQHRYLTTAHASARRYPQSYSPLISPPKPYEGAAAVAAALATATARTLRSA